jgi:hypothetical protein
MPPRSSMARATSASGERNPNAILVNSRSLVVDALDPGVGKAVDQCGVDPRAMFADRPGELHKRRQLRTPGPSEPGIQQRHAVDALELEDLPELLLEQVGAVERGVGLGDPGQGRHLAFGEVFGVLPDREPGVLQVLGRAALTVLAGCVPHLAADLVQGFGGPLHYVERIMPTSA